MDIFVPIFKALELAKVRYLTVGGLATVLHGYPRFTSGIDLIVQLDEQNCKRAIECLLQLKFRSRAPVCSVEMTPIDPPVRLNVSGHLLPIRLKSEPETVHAHGLTLVFFADLRVISTEHTG